MLRCVCVHVDSWWYTCFHTPRVASTRSSTALCRTTSAAPFVPCGVACVITVGAAVNRAESAAVADPPTGTSSSWLSMDARRETRPWETYGRLAPPRWWSKRGKDRPTAAGGMTSTSTFVITAVKPHLTDTVTPLWPYVVTSRSWCDRFKP